MSISIQSKGSAFTKFQPVAGMPNNTLVPTAAKVKTTVESVPLILPSSIPFASSSDVRLVESSDDFVVSPLLQGVQISSSSSSSSSNSGEFVISDVYVQKYLRMIGEEFSSHEIGIVPAKKTRFFLVAEILIMLTQKDPLKTQEKTRNALKNFKADLQAGYIEMGYADGKMWRTERISDIKDLKKFLKQSFAEKIHLDPSSWLDLLTNKIYEISSFPCIEKTKAKRMLETLWGTPYFQQLILLLEELSASNSSSS